MLILSIVGGIVLAILVIAAFSGRRFYGFENDYFSSAGDKARAKIKRKEDKKKRSVSNG